MTRQRLFGPGLAVRVLMLTAAYAPLLILLALLDSFRIDWLRWAMFGLALISFVVTAAFFELVIGTRNPTPEKIATVHPRDAEALRFFASYVVPFFVTSSAASNVRWGLLIYLILIAILYLQSDLYYSNPLVALLGYRVFEMTRSDGGFMLVLSRRRHFVPGEVVKLISLGGWVAIHRRESIDDATT